MRNFDEIRNTPFILASKSPRRKSLLEEAGLKFTVKAVETDETISPDLSLDQVPVEIARVKAEAVAAIDHSGQLIIAADTIVVGAGEIMGKPKDAADATRMLKKLSGQPHQVITGVYLQKGENAKGFHSTTEVVLDELTASEIAYYIEQYRPYDKAGAYAIQEWIGLLRIREIRGCYYNVVGLPVSKLYDQLTRLTWL